MRDELHSSTTNLQEKEELLEELTTELQQRKREEEALCLELKQRADELQSEQMAHMALDAAHQAAEQELEVCTAKTVPVLLGRSTGGLNNLESARIPRRWLH